MQAGKFQAELGQTSCTDCPARFFGVDLGQTSVASCTACDTGKYTSAAGATSCFSFTTATLRKAVTAWCDGDETTYGHISDWITSGVEDMSLLFSRYDSSFNDGGAYCSTYDTFDEDLSRWDTSRVTTMDWMFAGAENFNWDISPWDMSSVTTVNGMFVGASSFDKTVCFSLPGGATTQMMFFSVRTGLGQSRLVSAGLFACFCVIFLLCL